MVQDGPDSTATDPIGPGGVQNSGFIAQTSLSTCLTVVLALLYTLN